MNYHREMLKQLKAERDDWIDAARSEADRVNELTAALAAEKERAEKAEMELSEIAARTLGAVPRHDSKGFFRWAYYILAGAVAGVAVGGVIAPAFELDVTQAYGLLSAAIGALSVVVVIRARGNGGGNDAN